jgi:hypothetical protein
VSPDVQFRQMVTSAINSDGRVPERAGEDIAGIINSMTANEIADTLIVSVGAFCALMYRAFGVEDAPEAWRETCLSIEVGS